MSQAGGYFIPVETMRKIKEAEEAEVALMEERIRAFLSALHTVYERHACPACSAPIGIRCVRRGSSPEKAKSLKHHHPERLRAAGFPAR